MGKHSPKRGKSSKPKIKTIRKIKLTNKIAERCADCGEPVRENQDKDWCSGCNKKVYHGISEEICGGTYFCVCGEPICKTCKNNDIHCEGSSSL